MRVVTGSRHGAIRLLHQDYGAIRAVIGLLGFHKFEKRCFVTFKVFYQSNRLTEQPRKLTNSPSNTNNPAEADSHTLGLDERASEAKKLVAGTPLITMA